MGGDDALYGNGGADLLDGGAGHDVFVLGRGGADGDTLADFTPGTDALWFVGFGSAGQGATFTQSDATHWTINSSDGLAHETLTVGNGAAIGGSDYRFL